MGLWTIAFRAVYKIKQIRATVDLSPKDPVGDIGDATIGVRRLWKMVIWRHADLAMGPAWEMPRLIVRKSVRCNCFYLERSKGHR
jgi:hypothetical protein